MREVAAGTRTDGRAGRGRRRVRLAAQRDLHRRHRRRSRACTGDAGALTVIDATSAAGGIDFDGRRDRRLLLRARRRTSPRTAASGSRSSRRRRSSASSASRRSDRYIPEFLSLKNALDNSRLNQTLNTPALATLFLLDEQLTGSTRNGGLAWADARTRESSGALYDWAAASDVATPVRRRSCRPLPGRRHDRLRRVGGCRRHRRDPARQRHRRHRAVPQARPQPAARRDLRRDRTRRRARSSSAAIDYVLENL